MQKLLFSNGNKKIGNDTLIINLHTATDCPAKDMCLVRDVCYAWSNERLRPTVLAFRSRQEKLWEAMPAEFFITELVKLKKEWIRYIRFQEAGDFASQEDVDKLTQIADGVKGYYHCYTYTARFDLDYSNRGDNLLINGSYFMVDNSFIPFGKEPYELILQANPKVLRCPGDCRKCNLCKIAGHNEIYIQKH